VKKVKEKKKVTSKTTKKATKPKEQRLKRNFSELISHSIKEDLNEEQRKKDWPKFLGSLKVECQAFYFFASSTISKIAPGKKITFKPKKIEWNVLNFKKSVATYKIKGKDLKIEAYFDDVCVKRFYFIYINFNRLDPWQQHTKKSLFSSCK